MKKRISLFIQISDSLASLQNNSVEDESIKMEQETCPWERSHEFIVSEHIEEHETTVEQASDASHASNAAECGGLTKSTILEYIWSEVSQRGETHIFGGGVANGKDNANEEQEFRHLFIL